MTGVEKSPGQYVKGEIDKSVAEVRGVIGRDATACTS